MRIGEQDCDEICKGCEKENKEQDPNKEYYCLSMHPKLLILKAKRYWKKYLN